MLELMYITNNPVEAAMAIQCGVGRIFVDLEHRGKFERQKNKDTYISNHRIADICPIKSEIGQAPLMVRINPIHPGSEAEINSCIQCGADILMLPMFTAPWEASRFLEIVNGRARTCMLCETASALCRIDDILAFKGIDELYVGLNDLSLSMKLDFMFEPLSGGIVEYISKKTFGLPIKFGFGGIARLGEGVIPAEVIIAEHYRLGSEMVILSRTFRQHAHNADVFQREIHKIREYEATLSGWDSRRFLENQKRLHDIVRKYVEGLTAPRQL